MVLFIAPVTPELQCDPKLIHAIRATANNFAANGGGVFPSLELGKAASKLVSCLSSVGSETSSRADLEAISLAAMASK